MLCFADPRQLVPDAYGVVVQVARSAGKEDVTLHTTEQMVAAQRIYRSLGFRRDRSRDIELHPDLVLQAFRLPLQPPG